MLRQPHPDYIVKPMPEVIPAFEIAPLERARTDRAANGAHFGSETALQREFREDGRSEGDGSMPLAAVVVCLAAAAIGWSILYGVWLAAPSVIKFLTAHAAHVGLALAAFAFIVVAYAMFLRVRSGRRARKEAYADTGFGELA